MISFLKSIVTDSLSFSNDAFAVVVGGTGALISVEVISSPQYSVNAKFLTEGVVKLIEATNLKQDSSLLEPLIESLLKPTKLYVTHTKCSEDIYLIPSVFIISPTKPNPKSEYAAVRRLLSNLIVRFFAEISSSSSEQYEHFNDLLQENWDVGYFVLDDVGEITFCNNSFASILGQNRGEVLGQHLFSFATEPTKKNLTESFKLLLNAQKSLHLPAEFKGPRLETIHTQITLRPVHEKGDIVNVIGLLRECNDIKERDEEIDSLKSRLIEVERILQIERSRSNNSVFVLEELNRLKNEFVSNISHELRTPLASVIGFAETIDSDPSMPEAMRSDFIKIILQESKRLAMLIDKVLDNNRLESGTVIPEKTDFDLTELLRDLIKYYEPHMKNAKLTFTFDLPHVQILVYADKNQIHQVIDQLLSNAQQFTPPGGRVNVVAQTFSREFEVVISDTGIGIPRNELPFIFQKFYRSSKLDASRQGSGLGLSLAKQIVELHKGVITVYSEEDKGTTFVVKLPYGK